MKISTKGRYALRMMLEFAMNPNECTKISQVAKRQGISDKYLEQIVTLLARAGYVKSMRGAQGGYKLAFSPGRIYRRHDPACNRRQSGSSCLSGGRYQPMRAIPVLRDFKRMGEIRQSHQRCGRSYHSGRSGRGTESNARL